MLPGGVANPDFLRTDEDAVGLRRGFFEQAKPVGVICHGPWTLVEADVLKGRTLTSWPSLQTDLENAGGDLGRRGGPRRRGPRELAQPGRPAGVLRQDRRGVRRGQARRRRRAQRKRSWPTAILDIDGTLVDTNYHHAIAWYRAFRAHGFVLPLWRIHRHIGMGGDQLVAALAGEGFDREHGDDVRAAEKVLYMQLIDEVAAARGRARADRGPQGRGPLASCSPPRPSPRSSSTT